MSRVTRLDPNRRAVLKAGGASAILGAFVAAGLITPQAALAQGAPPWNAQAFSAKTLAEVVRALGGATPVAARDVDWGATPDVAENGSQVQVSFASRLPKTEAIALVIDRNPNALAALFELPSGTDAAIQVRVKMAQSANIHALIRADGKFFVATREVKVTAGGCGA